MNSKKNIMRYLFLYYSFLIQILHSFLDLMPPFLRFLIFKILMKKIGFRVFIDFKVYFRYPKRIIIGNDVSINRGCEFYPSFYNKKATIELGNNIRIGPGVKFFAAGHDYKSIQLPDTSKKIQINDNVWIGANSSILQGVSIGEGAVIAAGSIVTKNIPPYEVYGGINAKKIKKRDLE